MNNEWADMEAQRQKIPGGIVIYLEGKTDVDIFWALLGLAKPSDDKHGRGLVIGLKKDNAPGAGCKAVKQKLKLAQQNNQSGRFVGICDGDGRALNKLNQRFQQYTEGKPFYWPAYCIENLLAKTVWPEAWGVAPDWNTALLDYAPYVALGALHRELRGRLETLGLAKYLNPQTDGNLLSRDDVLQSLENDQHLITGFDVAGGFQSCVQDFQNAVQSTLDEAHTKINGKWLLTLVKRTVSHLNVTKEDKVRAEWCDAVRAAGGLAEVKDWWTRVTGEQLA
jgi:hypothetical protein